MSPSLRADAVSAPARGSLIAFTALLAALLTLGFALTAPSPVGAVAQTGDRNYAGPAGGCPGEDWECTSTFPVEQEGNENIIVCTGDTAACAGSSQSGDSNKIECISEEVGVETVDFVPSIQACGPFNQSGGKNEAIFKLTHVNTTGSTQCATQTGEIFQFGDENLFKADFRIEQKTTTGSTQIQDARQSLEADQQAFHKNQSDVEQIQQQVATGNATTQTQNAGCGTADLFDDCSDSFGGPTTPNTCTDVEQDVPPEGDSENISKLKQEVKQEATTRNVAATLQQQGTPTGGNDGEIHQEVPDGDGKNTDVADQYTQQKLVAPRQAINGALEQEQWEDPGCCGRASQFGGEGSEEIINQFVQQQAGRFALQVASAKGLARSPDGDCTINQTIQIDEGSSSVSVSNETPTCPILIVQTTCASDSEGDTCDVDIETEEPEGS